jgi:hypothetical protein
LAAGPSLKSFPEYAFDQEPERKRRRDRAGEYRHLKARGRPVSG